METRAELAVPRTYVENQAILGPILFYRASKCKQTKEQGSKTIYVPIFLPSYVIIISFFSFFRQNAGSNCAIITSCPSAPVAIQFYIGN